MIPWLQTDEPFPDPAIALTETDGANGLLAAGADLSPERLLLAYRHGIFPWFSEDQPILWWSPDPRMVLFTDRFIISRSMEKVLKKVAHSMRLGGEWEMRFDSDFEAVMRACAAPRGDGAGTWISEDIIAGYCGLHRRGYAHSSELWFRGQLVGGAYGVSIGRMFYGESMFARTANASKIALTYLVAFLNANGVTMIDCQQQTAHLSSLGATVISRDEFIAHLLLAAAQAQIENWEPPDLY
ncbi:MAG: leucyl/phenylalanyl-tRNA--protein transferase [Burkholderiales bacterium]